jgi:5-formyltetrahydrofolate cyclo-ligase
VAVNRKGVRIGKGGGYSDLEFALAREAGVIGDWTTVATTVHDLQVLDEDLPETRHDFRVDLVATPEGVIHVSEARGLRGPPGILWGDLSSEKIDAIPELARRRKSRPDRANLADPRN